MNAAVNRRSFIAATVATSMTMSAAAESVLPPITALAFSPNGKQIIAGSQAGLSIRKADNGAEIMSVDVGLDNIHDVRFAPDKQLLAVAGGVPAETGIVQLLRWPSLDRQQQVDFGEDVIYSIRFSADGSQWVAAAGDEICSVFRSGSNQPATRFTRHSRGVMAAAYLPDGETIVSGSRDQTLRVWKASSGENLRTLHNHSRDVTDLAVKPTVEGLPMVASASLDFTVRLWQPTIGRMVRFARLPSEPLCIAWCGGQRLVAGCRDGSARLIDAQSVQIERTIPLCQGWLFSVAVDPTDDRHIAFGSNQGRVFNINLADTDG